MISAQSEHAFLGIDHFGQTCIVHTNGNPYGHLVLRGGKSGPNFGSESIAAAQELLSKADVPSRLLVDCSHGNSNKDHTRQNFALNSIIEQRIAGNDDIIGCMLESNLNPGQPESQWDPCGTGVWRVGYGCLHRLGGDGRDTSRGV